VNRACQQAAARLDEEWPVERDRRRTRCERDIVRLILPSENTDSEMRLLRWTAATLAGVTLTASAQTLPALALDAETFTVSGLSSGAYMAVQLAVAHSARVTGVGVFAGGPYYCVAANPLRAERECMRGAPNPNDSVLAAKRFAEARWVDSSAHLQRTRAWVLAGGKDNVVAEPVVRAASEFFAAFNRPGVVYRLEPGLGHALPTDGHGTACEVSAPPYLANCGLAAVGQMLAHVAPSEAPLPPGGAGQLRKFEQGGFVPLWRRLTGAASFDTHGYLYVPARCAGGARCRLHIALHGCRQGAAAVGEEFVRNAGYNAWADRSDTVVLYPQIKPNAPTLFAWWLPNNPRGCWDWWGYTGTDYALKRAAQIAAIVAMVDRLAAPR
jgi:poly(3-hydroxybutyrate) depolymerase